MATKVEAARERLYDDDFYAWTGQQAALLRARRFNALDLDHLIEATLELATCNARRCSATRGSCWSIS